MDSKAIKQERSQPIGDEREGKKEGAKHRFWSVVKDKAKEFEMTVLAGGFQSVLKLFARTFKNFEYEVKEAFKREDSERCNAILEQVRMINKSIMCENFKKNITTSEISKDGSLAFELLYDSSLIDLSCNIVKEEQEEDIKEISNSTFIIPKTTLDKHTQIQNDISKEMTENHSKTLKQTEQKFQEQIYKLNENIKSLREQKEKSDNLAFEFRSNISDKEKQTITEKELKAVYEQLSALKLKYQHLQTQNGDLQFKLKTEHQLVKKTKKDLQKLLCESIYQGNVQKKRLFDSNFAFELSFKNDKHKDQIDAFTRTRLKLPDIKSIKISDINNPQLESINKFLEKSSPDSLQLLCLNWHGEELLEGAKIIKGLINSLHKSHQRGLFGKFRVPVFWTCDCYPKLSQR
ncbi:unnamed protein product [Moneuplotes crassus]|uniref:Uncharacterized protein n=1 Tax=Euplotes crassus TaxID=5936 RepID=A0AAD1U4D8_EUPCR|nr:unnamed protein product [Moneuplotes crassus]